MPFIEATVHGIVLSVRVIPRAGRPGVDGTRDGALLVRVNAPPVEGAANEAVLEVLAGALDVPKRRVAIVSGARSRHKRIAIDGVTAADAEARLLARAR